MNKLEKKNQLEMLAEEGPRARIKNLLSPFKNMISVIESYVNSSDEQKRTLLLSYLKKELRVARVSMKVIKLISEETDNDDLWFKTSELELLISNMEIILEATNTDKRSENILKFSLLKNDNLRIINEVIESAPEK